MTRPSTDEILRSAGRAIQGDAPFEDFVAMLDDQHKRALAWALLQAISMDEILRSAGRATQNNAPFESFLVMLNKQHKKALLQAIYSEPPGTVVVGDRPSSGTVVFSDRNGVAFGLSETSRVSAAPAPGTGDIAP